MVITMTAGTVFLMWLGEQIDEYGIGNGISLIIMAGIIARMPAATTRCSSRPASSRHRCTLGGASGDIGLEKLIVLVVLFVGVVVAVVAITKGRRRIPRNRPSTSAAGASTAARGSTCRSGSTRPASCRSSSPAACWSCPRFIFGGHAQPSGWRLGRADRTTVFERQGYCYTMFYIALIYFFCYFWTAISFNPKDMADNLKDYGSFIPGYRPGKRTAEYLERVMVRITYVGAGLPGGRGHDPQLISKSAEHQLQSPASTAAPAC